MSVIVHEPEKLQRLADRLNTAADGNGLSVYVPPERRSWDRPVASSATDAERRSYVCWVLECCQIAEMAAWLRTYGDAPATPRAQLDPDGGANLSTDPVGLAEELGSLSYNAVSNGGTCFLPREAREALESWRLQLLERSCRRAARC